MQISAIIYSTSSYYNYLLNKMVMMICSDICADAAGYIWPPIYQTVLVRGAAEPPNQVNRELFTAGKHPSRPITHLP